ncbi:MAG: UDP-N-acetylmuramoyl-L-alanine--D-glutamate ligase [Gammaproteobacteria bacterium]|nr:UDP-N-acetylmuramoyl-L-alanine--D-glutamate ligase [Gammaproteobacteria bacterium]MCW8840079.1 UDP-N-acetylmuramoyl-L-alanine--D-glutamate ligase [Gammaproteobacteria bacterium]MCW8928080.1 UDP-N-acetylmuramoyl-L-alanine--D-glutamate ligase [Gammaproteobacteria bacterium]MCW8959731.1 UDP-N-acetylmuramoyl-L-alanine--D-glutamate ligase [Gammaproteobacteria bacterium]MCW8971928.1 UDP-N-acetylmuramoyl-L-alanine--D-glutamate ligase [Gammaproteobacteria bacterium]
MATKQPADSLTLVVGLGQTGLACARFLSAQGEPFAVVDSRNNPPGLETLRREFPQVPVYLGEFDRERFLTAGRLLLSPGVAPQQPVVSEAQQAGIELLGDVELFARHAKAPVIAITGSNGKSTVTALLGEMAKQAGKRVLVGGNIGTPALALLEQPVPELYVLELSSFQLEVTRSLNCRAAAVLNLSEDHLDRHRSLANYAAIKARIYAGDGVMVINADDPLVAAMAEGGRQVTRFTLGTPKGEHDYGLLVDEGRDWLARGGQRLMPVNQMRMPGRHNQANALAALALGEAAGLTLAPMLQTLREFAGLPHRCQWVAEIDQVNYYEDSKGTNVGATLAALAGLPGEKVVLIAGGQGKGQDFAPLREVVAQRARCVVLIGEDAPVIARALEGAAELEFANSMEQAVEVAAGAARTGDSVLLSPACASFDMFSNYAARGEAFVAAVQGRRR